LHFCNTMQQFLQSSHDSSKDDDCKRLPTYTQKSTMELHAANDRSHTVNEVVVFQLELHRCNADTRVRSA
jgi:hypothetical protein